MIRYFKILPYNRNTHVMHPHIRPLRDDIDSIINDISYYKGYNYHISVFSQYLLPWLVPIIMVKMLICHRKIWWYRNTLFPIEIFFPRAQFTNIFILIKSLFINDFFFNKNCFWKQTDTLIMVMTIMIMMMIISWQW